MPTAHDALAVDTAMIPVLVIPVGSYGIAVTRYLQELRGDTILSDMESVETTRSRMLILTAGRPASRQCNRVVKVGHQCRQPFIPLVQDSGYRYLGPVTMPDSTGCWTCWAIRVRQHSRHAVSRTVVSTYYDEHPGAEPRGYLEPFALLGAACIARAIDAVDSGHAIGGQVWRMDIITREVTIGTVVGVHDCPLCGLHRPADTRSFIEMRDALSALSPL